MDYKLDLDAPILDELYIKTIFLTFSLLDQSSIPYPKLYPYLKLISQKPMVNLNLIPINITEKVGKYQKVGVGGTFDRLHLGHQILILTTLLLSKKDVFIGVISDEMLAKKHNKEIIQPVHLRIRRVKEYIEKIFPQKSNMNIIVQKITDPFGPTIIDPQFDCLAVSEETIPGGNKINEIRKQKGMNEMEIKVVPALSPQTTESDISSKISSSSIREYILKKNKMSIQDFKKYKEQWNDLMFKICKYFQVDHQQEVIERWWFTLLAHYSEDWRFYHTNHHINSILHEYSQIQFKLTEMESIAILVSVWFHDIIYIPSSAHNEQDSADLCQKFLLELLQNKQSSHELIQLVKKAIISTKNHQPANIIEEILIDLDMEILNSELPIYQQYSDDILQEYTPLVKSEYKNKRIQFLKTVNPDKVFTHKKPVNVKKNIDWQIQHLGFNSQL